MDRDGNLKKTGEKAVHTSLTVTVADTKQKLLSLQKTCLWYSKKAKLLETIETDEKIKELFHVAAYLLICLSSAITSKLEVVNSCWMHHTFILCKDCDNLTQAIGMVLPNHHLNSNCAKMVYLVTAPWNLGKTRPSFAKVKGGGTSLVKFCSELGKLYGSSGEVYLSALEDSLEFYKKLGFKEYGTKFFHSTPMLLAADAAKRL